MQSGQIEDKEEFGLLELLAWVELNKKPIIAAVAVVVVVVVGLSIYNWNSDRTEAEANQALASIPWMLGTGGEDSKPDPAALAKVSDDYPGTGAGRRAAVLGGVALFDVGKYAEARAAFDKFLGEHPDSPMAAQARVGVASSLDAEGKFDEALAKYSEIVRNAQLSAGMVEVKLNMARIYEKQNKPDQALSIYDSLKAIPGRSLWGSEVEERQRLLLLAHPELAKHAATNAAPGTPVFSPPPLQPQGAK